MKILISLIVACFAFASLTHAQTTYRWVGGNGDWSNQNKWNPVGLPGALDTAEIMVDGNYRVTLDLNNVTVASARIGYLGSGSTFTQELYMEGKTLSVNDSVKVNIRGKLMLWNNSILSGTGIITNLGTLLIKQSTVHNNLVNRSSGSVEGYSQSSLNGNIVNEGFLGTYGTYAYGSAFLTIANGFTNQGTVRLWGDNTGSIVGDATIIVTSGSLVNNNKIISGGTETYGGNSYLRAELVNNDSLVIYSRPFLLDKAGAHHVNNGFIHLINSSINQREFNVVQSGTSPYFNNNGVIQIDNNCKMLFKAGTLNLNSDDVIAGGIFVVKDTCLVNLNVNYAIAGSWTIEVRNLSTVNGPGVITNQGSLVLYKGSISSNLINTTSGYIQAFGQSSLNGSIVNQGFLGAYGTYGYGSAFLTIASGFTNEGTLRLWGDNTGSIVGDATITVTNGSLTNNRKIISGGSESYGGVNYLKGELVNNDSTIISARYFVLDKAGAHHVNNGFIHFQRSTWNQREFELIQSGSSPSFDNYGTFKIDSTNILRLSQGSFINRPSGIITGIGSINSQNGTLSNRGQILPGDDIGTFSVVGNYPEVSTAVVKIDLGGYLSGVQHDRLSISGAASLSGMLSIRLVNGFLPAIGDSFRVVSFGSRSGSFSSIVDSNLTPSDLWDTIYTANGLYVRLIRLTGIGESETHNVPTEYALEQNYPNPFNPTTTISFQLPASGHVLLSIYNVLGQEVATLLHERRSAGTHTVHWNGLHKRGGQVSSGVYFYRIEVKQNNGQQQFVSSKKMVLMR